MKTLDLKSDDRKIAVILGIPINRLDYDSVMKRIFEFTDMPSETGCRMVATVNVDFMVNSHSFLWHHGHPEMCDILRRADLVTPDGMPLVLLSKMLGIALPERVAGVDLVQMIAEKAATNGKRLYFLGGAPDATQEAADILCSRFPGLCIAGISTPWVKLDDSAESKKINDEICETINAVAPDILLIGFGNPKQEQWLMRNQSRLKAPVAIGIGGTFNFISGKVKRAPKWVQKSGLEWIYRIIQEPTRLWKRYTLGLFVFGGLSCNALLASLLGLSLSFAGHRRAENLLNEESKIVILDCRSIYFCSNALRVQILSAIRYAEQNQINFQIINANPILKLQLHAHRMI